MGPDRDEWTRDPLFSDPQFAAIYDSNFASDRSDFEFCGHLATKAKSILDLGCGTGTFLTTKYAGGKATGVDPAGAMLEIARQRKGGSRVNWIEADARTVRLNRRFDLVLLTGHAFQVFLTREDQQAVLNTIACHLAPGGRFVFDTRNPLVQAWKRWTPELSRHWIEHPQMRSIETWNDVFEDRTTGVVTYETHYRIDATGKSLRAVSQIAFPAKETVEELLLETGLVADQWLGDWQGNAYRPDRPEIIPIGRLSDRAA